MPNPTSKELRFLEELKAAYAKKKVTAREIEEAYVSSIADEAYRVLPYFTLYVKQMLQYAVQREDDFITIHETDALYVIKQSRSILENILALVYTNKSDEKVAALLMDSASTYFKKLGFKVAPSTGPFSIFKSFSLSGWT